MNYSSTSSLTRPTRYTYTPAVRRVPLAQRNPTIITAVLWFLASAAMLITPIALIREFITFNLHPLNMGGFFILMAFFVVACVAVKRIWT